MLLLIIRMTKYLNLIDEISPLIDIIFKIVRDIKYFMALFILFVICLSDTFFLVGQNQIQFDDSITDEQKESIPYNSFLNSLLYVSSLSLGELDISSFDYGTNKNQQWLLIVFFYVAAFVMMIHMLNMLIAIMGSIYNDRIGVANQVKIRDHL